VLSFIDPYDLYGSVSRVCSGTHALVKQPELYRHVLHTLHLRYRAKKQSSTQPSTPGQTLTFSRQEGIAISDKAKLLAQFLKRIYCEPTPASAAPFRVARLVFTPSRNADVGTNLLFSSLLRQILHEPHAPIAVHVAHPEGDEAVSMTEAIRLFANVSNAQEKRSDEKWKEKAASVASWTIDSRLLARLPRKETIVGGMLPLAWPPQVLAPGGYCIIVARFG